MILYRQVTQQIQIHMHLTQINLTSLDKILVILHRVSDNINYLRWKGGRYTTKYIVNDFSPRCLELFVLSNCTNQSC